MAVAVIGGIVAIKALFWGVMVAHFVFGVGE